MKPLWKFLAGLWELPNQILQCITNPDREIRDQSRQISYIAEIAQKSEYDILRVIISWYSGEKSEDYYNRMFGEYMKGIIPPEARHFLRFTEEEQLMILKKNGVTILP